VVLAVAVVPVVVLAALVCSQSHVDPRITLALFQSGSVLLVTDLLHSVHDFPHQSLLNGNVRHRRSSRRAVPMLLTRWKPDHVARPDLLDWPAPTLRPPKARRDDQCLT
jgi:hypothetical protein